MFVRSEDRHENDSKNENVHLKKNSVRDRRLKLTGDEQREIRRKECGWASDPHRPYRALGTPDLDIKPYSTDDSENFTGKSGQGTHEVLNRHHSKIDSNLAELLKKQQRGLADNGYCNLKRALGSSHRRVRGCRTGGSFTDQMQLNLQPAPPGRPVVPKLALSAMSNSAMGGGAGSGGLADGSGMKGSQSARSSSTVSCMPPGGGHSTDRPSRPVTSRQQGNSGSFLPQINTREGHSGKDRADAAAAQAAMEALLEQERQDAELDALWNTFDPAVAMENSIEEFNTVQRTLKNQLTSRIDSMTHSRKDIYRRKFLAFNADRTLFSSRKWEMDAKRHYDAACKKAISQHPWFSQFEMMAADGKKGKGMTEEEAYIIRLVKEVVETGGIVDTRVFYKIFQGLDRDDLEAGQVPKMIIFLRETLGISVDEMKKTLSQLNLPIPFALTKPSNQSSGANHRESYMIRQNSILAPNQPPLSTTSTRISTMDGHTPMVPQPSLSQRLSLVNTEPNTTAQHHVPHPPPGPAPAHPNAVNEG